MFDVELPITTGSSDCSPGCTLPAEHTCYKFEAEHKLSYSTWVIKNEIDFVSKKQTRAAESWQKFQPENFLAGKKSELAGRCFVRKCSERPECRPVLETRLVPVQIVAIVMLLRTVCEKKDHWTLAAVVPLHWTSVTEIWLASRFRIWSLGKMLYKSLLQRVSRHST